MVKRLVMAALGLGVLASGAFAQDVKTVAGDLPGEAEFEALAGLEGLADRDVVLLDLNMLPLA